MAQKCFLKAKEKICVKKRQANIEQIPLLHPPPRLLATPPAGRRAQVFVTPHLGEVCVWGVCGAQQRSNGSWRRCQIVPQVAIECVWRRLINYCFKGNSSAGGVEEEGGVAVVICFLSIFVINIRGAAKYAAATCLAYLMAYFSACPDIFQYPAANCVHRVCWVRQLAWEWNTF